jgi:TolB-like protein
MLFSNLSGRSLDTRSRDTLKENVMKMRWVLLILIPTLLMPLLSDSQTKDANHLYHIAIFPFLIHSQERLDYMRDGIYDILSSRITVEGKTAVIDRARVERVLNEERPTHLDDDVAKKIGMKVGADYVVFGSLTKVGTFISLDARMISIRENNPPLTAFTQHKGLDDVMTNIGDFAQEIGMKILGHPSARAQALDPRRTGLVYPEEGGRSGRDFSKSEGFDFEIKGLDIGDVDGDQKNELVVMDTHTLYIFKYDGGKMTLLEKIEYGNENNFLTLDVADINRNGYAEIIVTNLIEDNLRSFILEFEQGKLRKITDKAEWFFRVLDHPNEGPLLMGQQMGSEGIMAGPIYRMVWRKNSFENSPKMPFPKETTLFGIGLVEGRDKGSLDTVVHDDFSQLKILDPKEKYLLRSNDQARGTTNFYETKKKKDLSYKDSESPPWRVYIPGRIVVRHPGREGKTEIIINQNQSVTGNIFDRIRIFDKGKIYGFIRNGNAFVTKWATREMNGYISDFQVRDVDNDGEEELVVSVVSSAGVFDRKGTSNIFFFKLSLLRRESDPSNQQGLN